MGDPLASRDGQTTPAVLTAACQGFALLALEGLSLGLCLAEMALWTRLPTYVTRNEIAHGARLGLLAAMALGAAGLCAGGALLLRRDPTCGAHAVRRLDPALLSPTTERPRAIALLESGEFGVVAMRGPFALARRGHATAGNAGALERLTTR